MSRHKVENSLKNAIVMQNSTQTINPAVFTGQYWDNTKMQNEQIRIREILEIDELKVVEQLAMRIFPQTYQTILAKEQIPYMVHMMYDESVLRKEFSENMHFALIQDGETPIGYISWHRLDDKGMTAVKLEKLYLDFAYHGCSIGNMALRFIIETAEKDGVSLVLLNVNKENIRAQKAYRRAGFTLRESVKNPIGNGYFMDDYVMEYRLHH